jgi:hypothetical protein
MGMLHRNIHDAVWTTARDGVWTTAHDAVWTTAARPRYDRA